MVASFKIEEAGLTVCDVGVGEVKAPDHRAEAVLRPRPGLDRALHGSSFGRFGATENTGTEIYLGGYVYLTGTSGARATVTRGF